MQHCLFKYKYLCDGPQLRIGLVHQVSRKEEYVAVLGLQHLSSKTDSCDEGFENDNDIIIINGFNDINETLNSCSVSCSVQRLSSNL